MDGTLALVSCVYLFGERFCAVVVVIFIFEGLSGAEK